MTRFTSLLLAALFCFVGINLTGCGGGGESTVVESDLQNDDGLSEQQEMDYEAEMAKMESQG